MTTDNEKNVKAVKLDNSRMLDVHKWSDYPEVNEAVAYIYYLFNTLADFTGNINIQKRHIKTIIIDLFDCWLSDSEMYIAYHRGSDGYKPTSRYNKIHISKTTPKVVDYLISLGLIEHHIGHYDRTGTGSSHLSRMRATQVLIDLITNNYGWSPKVIDRLPETECIILRDKKPGSRSQVNIEYEDTPETNRMRQELTNYNNLLRRTFLDIPLGNGHGVETAKRNRVVNITQNEKFVRRIFNNGTFDEGGRFYGGWWQRIPAAARGKIRIFNNPVSEFDYSGLHVILLYALNEIDYWTEVGADPYEIPDVEYSERMRDFEKKMVLIAINAKSLESAVRAIRRMINLNSGHYNWVKEEGVNYRQILDRFINKHSRIKEYFFSNSGIKLQRLDSSIAEKVIKHFTDKNEVVLCVHDSFICRVQIGKELVQVMDAMFQSTVNELGLRLHIQPKLKGEYFEPKNWISSYSTKYDPMECVLLELTKTLEISPDWEERMNSFRKSDLEEEYYVAESNNESDVNDNVILNLPIPY